MDLERAWLWMNGLEWCRCGCVPVSTWVDKQDAQKQRVLQVALGLLGVFFIAEVGIGCWSGSLSLLADAGHLLADITALILATVANWLAQRPAMGRATFGHRRIQILAAFLNGLGLFVIAGFIAKEAIERLQNPEPVLGIPMLMGAMLGLLINSCNIALLHEQSHQDLNLRGAVLHMAADIASSLGVLVAATTVYLWQWQWVDPGASLLIASLTCCSALPLLRESLEILLEYGPRTLDPNDVEATLLATEAVERVETLHIWTVGSGQTLLCACLIVSEVDGLNRDRLLRQLQTELLQRFAIQQAILQLAGPAPRAAPSLHPLFQQDLAALIRVPAQKLEV